MPRSNFPIVGMGASADGLDAFKRFFQAVPADSGMAFVLIQHLDPTRRSLMPEILSGSTAMRVVQIADNTQVEPNHVYWIRPNAYLTIRDGILRLFEPTESRGMRKPIDIFLRSLAEDQQERSIAIILSGTGTNGTVGLKEVKGAGGIALVQDPKTAPHDGMPRSAINTGLVDFILPVEKMPDVLIDYAQHPYLKTSSNADLKTSSNAEPAADIAERFDEIIAFLRVRRAFDFLYSGKAALQALQTFQPDVVLSNLGLPDISGYEVARWVRNRYPQQPPLLIAFNGYFLEEDVQCAGKSGFDHYLLKPLEPGALNRLLEAGKIS